MRNDSVTLFHHIWEELHELSLLFQFQFQLDHPHSRFNLPASLTLILQHLLYLFALGSLLPQYFFGRLFQKLVQLKHQHMVSDFQLGQRTVLIGRQLLLQVHYVLLAVPCLLVLRSQTFEHLLTRLDASLVQ